MVRLILLSFVDIGLFQTCMCDIAMDPKAVFTIIIYLFRSNFVLDLSRLEFSCENWILGFEVMDGFSS